MSYDVYLQNKDGKPFPVEEQECGGTYAIGGAPEAWLNITYNYSEAYSLIGFSVKDLHGRTGRETEKALERVTTFLGTRRYNRDYWAPTPGNAGYAASVLLKWARQHPDGIWEIH